MDELEWTYGIVFAWWCKELLIAYGLRSWLLFTISVPCTWGITSSHKTLMEVFIYKSCIITKDHLFNTSHCATWICFGMLLWAWSEHLWNGLIGRPSVCCLCLGKHTLSALPSSWVRLLCKSGTLWYVYEDMDMLFSMNFVPIQACSLIARYP